VGAWYWIGVAAGVGAAAGVVVHGAIRDTRVVLPIALGVGAAAGYVLDGAIGAIAGAVASILGTLGTSPVVRGALTRGGTRGGTAALVIAAGVVLAAAAFVPVAGYVLALAVPAVGARLRRRHGERHAGLRILARD